MIGMIAACLTTLFFVPQAIQVIKTKDTSGISLIMYSMFVIGVFLWEHMTVPPPGSRGAEQYS